jgi:hypothetical protein
VEYDIRNDQGGGIFSVYDWEKPHIRGEYIEASKLYIQLGVCICEHRLLNPSRFTRAVS